MTHSFNYFVDKIDRVITSTKFDQEPDTLFEPIEYILSLGGKRVRPILTLMAHNLYTDNFDEALKCAMGIEVFHNFTLLHDDLMDKSDMRRGKPTVHKKWDANTAILSGDAMLIEAYKYVSGVSVDILPEVLSLFTKTAMEVCIGQQHDMDFEKRTDVSVDEYLEMIRLKTAVLIGCSLKMGAITARTSSDDADNLYEFGINLGLAFQLKDDLLDVYGDTSKFGKKIGGDIINNKKTYLLIKAFEESDEEQKKELSEWTQKTEFDNDEKISAVKNIYDKLNIHSITDELIKKYYLAALESLNKVSVDDSKKQELSKLAQTLMHREH